MDTLIREDLPQRQATVPRSPRVSNRALRAVELTTNAALTFAAVALAWAVWVHSAAVLVFAPTVVALMAVSSVAGVIRWRREDRARLDAAVAALPDFTYIGS